MCFPSIHPFSSAVPRLGCGGSRLQGVLLTSSTFRLLLGVFSWSLKMCKLEIRPMETHPFKRIFPYIANKFLNLHETAFSVCFHKTPVWHWHITWGRHGDAAPCTPCLLAVVSIPTFLQNSRTASRSITLEIMEHSQTVGSNGDNKPLQKWWQVDDSECSCRNWNKAAKI